MAKVFIEESTLTAIGDAIRGKEGTADLVPVIDMAMRIADLPSEGGGGGDEPTSYELTLTDYLHYAFYGGTWDWVINKYGDRMTTRDIRAANSMFQASQVEYIPFELNFYPEEDNHQSANFFYGASQLKEVPRINYCRPQNARQLFEGCNNLRYIPEDIEDWFDWSYLESNNGSRANGVRYCNSLRKLPENWLSHNCPSSTYSNSIYYYAFDGCYVLDEIVNLPVQLGTWTKNAFNHTFDNCYRIKNLTFETNDDGSPIVANWKNQTIDLFNDLSYEFETSLTSYYNSGITTDKAVTDDASYQALKDDPDWYSVHRGYFRYNHASAVNTINSLPDTSEYIAANGGTNTIKFMTGGHLTDEGATESLTEEEIAVAAAKGWTVTFSAE